MVCLPLPVISKLTSLYPRRSTSSCGSPGQNGWPSATPPASHLSSRRCTAAAAGSGTGLWTCCSWVAAVSNALWTTDGGRRLVAASLDPTCVAPRLQVGLLSAWTLGLCSAEKRTRPVPSVTAAQYRGDLVAAAPLACPMPWTWPTAVAGGVIAPLFPRYWRLGLRNGCGSRARTGGILRVC